ncbi:hypothetical protein GCM10009740_16870 [Terrabacter terrae]|uniref:Uncharacterized protein n=1 Tax=Terrabacter terrae TaxID=318434 RepID=A0ABN2U4M2_9MICO
MPPTANGRVTDAAAAAAHIRATYPWMDGRNVTHAINQSTYYAWHG